VREEVEAPGLARQFRNFGSYAGSDGAPLYRRLCEGVAGDEALLGLMAEAPPTQRRPNLLLAAVHYLLLAGVDDPLADHYPTVAQWRAPHRVGNIRRGGEDPFGDFAAFCRTYRDPLVALLATHSTQTNEVGRCTVLLPAFAAVAQAQDRPLALVDLGASAGLHLLFDRYAYSYRGPAGVVHAGDAASPVDLEAELRAGELPDLALPPVAHRAGIDRHPVDPDDEDQSRWLLACQWPDHLERFARLRAALDLARAAPDRARVAEGDMVRDLPAAAAAAPADAHLCLYHCWAVAYLPPERQRQLVATIEGVARERPVSWVFAELPYEVPSLPVPPAPGDHTVKGATALVRVDFGPGRRAARRLADVHPHGRWIHWWPDSD
jgi:hypothetical protein